MRVKDKVEIVLGCVVLASIVFTGIGLEKTSSKSAITRDSSGNVIITQELVDTGKDYERISTIIDNLDSKNMAINTEYLQRCLLTLEKSYRMIKTVDEI